ncbi:MAG: NINE protein [Actinocatenispora sp.]
MTNLGDRGQPQKYVLRSRDLPATAAPDQRQRMTPRVLPQAPRMPQQQVAPEQVTPTRYRPGRADPAEAAGSRSTAPAAQPGTRATAEPNVNVVVNQNVSQQTPAATASAVSASAVAATAEAGIVLRRNWLAALLLSIFLGVLGIDAFYLGQVGKGVLKLLTGGLFGILWIVDIAMIATKSVRGIYWT